MSAPGIGPILFVIEATPLIPVGDVLLHRTPLRAVAGRIVREDLRGLLPEDFDPMPGEVHGVPTLAGYIDEDWYLCERFSCGIYPHEQLAVVRAAFPGVTWRPGATCPGGEGRAILGIFEGRVVAAIAPVRAHLDRGAP